MRKLTSGIALAGIFGWILAFPMFGRFLVDTAGDQAALAGLIFAFSHGISLLLLHLLPLKIATEPIWVRGSAGLIALTSILYAWAIAQPGSFTSTYLLVWMGTLGLASAFVVLAWVPTFTRQVRPLPTLLIAMPGANLIVALVSLPIAFPTLPALTLLSLLPLASAYLIGRSLKETEADLDSGELTNRIASLAATRPRRIRELVLFALAVYFAGGLWYQQIASAGGPWAATAGALISAAVVAAVGLLTPKEQTERLVLYTVTFLGIGLLVSSEWLGLRWAIPVYSALLLAGFATGDLHFWNQLGLVGAGRDGRRVFGLGLGGSLILIVLSGMLPGSSWISLLFSHPSSSTMGAILLFLIIPLLYSPQRILTVTVANETPVQVHGPPPPPADLTRTEVQVWSLLLNGASDPEIGSALSISRHTAKFHVRNVLQKAGATNRKELLARLLARPECRQE